MSGITGSTSPSDDFTVDSFGVRGATGPSPLGTLAPWVKGTAYVVGPPASFVPFEGASYACLVGHTASDFATDLAAGDWGLVASAAPLTSPAQLILFARIFG